MLPYEEIKFDTNVKLEDTLQFPDDSDIGYFIEVDLTYPDNLKEKPKMFHLLLNVKKLFLMFLVNI